MEFCLLILFCLLIINAIIVSVSVRSDVFVHIARDLKVFAVAKIGITSLTHNNPTQAELFGAILNRNVCLFNRRFPSHVLGARRNLNLTKVLMRAHESRTCLRYLKQT